MKVAVLLLLGVMFFTACDDTRVYEENTDFEDRTWLIKNKPAFAFTISNTQQPYNIYCNVRNSIVYPYSRLFLTYNLRDSSGGVLQQKLVEHVLFDPVTGAPEGTSGLGDIYDHRLSLLANYKFPYAGKYQITFDQFMRTDSLQGILAVGVRIEKSIQE